MTLYRINGKRVTKEEWDAHPGVGLDLEDGHTPMVSTAYSETNPLISEGLGCMREQVPEFRELVRKHGIKGVRVLDSGQLEITSRRGRNEVCRLRGLGDGDAGYGDI